MSLITFTEEQERELSRLSHFYWKEAIRCEEAKAYLAGIAMLGSALEALLMLMVYVHEEEAEATGAYPRQGTNLLPLLDWNLGQLLKVAKAAGWLPYSLEADADWNSRKAKIGDYAEVSRTLRNLIHPGRYMKDHSPRRITVRYLKRQFDIVLLCRDWLAYHNSRSLLEHLGEEGPS